MRNSRLILLITSASLFLLSGAPPSWAHAELESSTPADASVLSAMPTTISLTFNEDLLALGEAKVNTITLIDPSGGEVLLATPKIEGSSISADIESNAGDFLSGRYQLTYCVVSADGHPVKGDITFNYAPAELSPNASQSPMPIAEVTTETSATSESTAINFSFIAPFILIILIIGALFIIRKKR